MADPLLAAMNLSGLMDQDFTDFLTPELNKDPKVKLDSTSHVIEPAATTTDDTQTTTGDYNKENKIPGKQLPAVYNKIARARIIPAIQLPPFMKSATRTIKLRNPSLAPNMLPTQNQSQALLLISKSADQTKSFSKPSDGNKEIIKEETGQSQTVNSNTAQCYTMKRPRVLEGGEVNHEQDSKVVNSPEQTMPEHAAKLMKFNETESGKNLEFYGLVPGTIQDLLKGAKIEQFSVQILSVKNRRVKISDGREVTDKCFIAPEMKNITFLSNPVINVLEWSLVNLMLSTTKSETVIKISKFALKENSKNFPVLGDPNKGHTSWSSIICFLEDINLNPVHENVDLLTERWAKTISTKMMAAMGYWHCADCKHYKSRQQRHMVNHIQISHLPNFPGYKCKECGKILPSTGEVERHLKSEHAGEHRFSPPVKQTQGRVAYRCPVLQCQLKLDSKEDFDIHIKTIHHLSLKFRDDVGVSPHPTNRPMISTPETINRPMISTPETTHKIHVKAEKSDEIQNPITTSPVSGRFDISSLENSPENITNLAANILGSMDTHFLTAEEAEETINKMEKGRVEEVAAKKNNNVNDATDKNLVKNCTKMSNVEKCNWDEEVNSRIMRAGVLFQCTECGYNKMKEDLMIDHVQGRHLHLFPGYECPRCKERFPTLVPFLVHMKMAHKSSPNEVERSRCLFRQSVSTKSTPRPRELDTAINMIVKDRIVS